MSRILETVPGFDPYRLAKRFEKRGWRVEFVAASNVDLISVTPNAATECGDGRFDLYRRESGIYGARLFGGVNAIAAFRTGGDYQGFYKAARLLEACGCAPGTHGAAHYGPGCGMFELWKNGQLESVVYPFAIPLERIAKEIQPSQWIKAKMRELGGKHMTLQGLHEEQGLRWNPFIGMTERAEVGDRFRVDDYVLAAAKVPEFRRAWFKAEIVEKLKPDAKKVEIIVP